MTIKVGPWVVRRRGAFLALMGAVWVLIGYSYMDIPPSQQPAVHRALHLAITVAPLWVHGLLWIVSGILAIGDGLRKGARSAVGFTAAIIMPTAWMCVYLAAWIDGDVPRGWVSALVFAALAGAIGIVAGMPAVRVPQ